MRALANDALSPGTGLTLGQVPHGHGNADFGGGRDGGDRHQHPTSASATGCRLVPCPACAAGSAATGRRRSGGCAAGRHPPHACRPCASSFVIVKHLHRLRCQLRQPSVRGNRMGSIRTVSPQVLGLLSRNRLGSSTWSWVDGGAAVVGLRPGTSRVRAAVRHLGACVDTDRELQAGEVGAAEVEECEIQTRISRLDLTASEDGECSLGVGRAGGKWADPYAGMVRPRGIEDTAPQVGE
jgi:hypothetical protein